MQTSSIQQKILGALSALAMLFATSALVSCSSDSSESSDMTVKISSVTGTSLKADGTTTLTAKVTDGGSSLSYVWSITGVDGTVASSSEYFKFDKTSGAAVDAKGTNTTTSSHKVTIECVVTDNSSKKTATDSLTITVKAADSALSSVSISGSTAIEAAENATLTATPTYTGSPEITYSWEITSGSDYASLSATSGSSVTIEGKNTTSSSQTIKVKVTASYKGTTQTDTKTITVAAVGATVEDEITSVTLSAKPESIEATGSATLTATPTYTGSPEITYSWEITSGSDYATLSKKTGNTVTLTAKNITSSNLNVIVKVSASDGINTKECTKTIAVAAANLLSKVEISGATSISATGKTTLTATPTFTRSDDSSNTTYKWEITSGSDYATLSATSGKTVTLTGNNTDSSSHDVTVKVTATYNGHSVDKSATVAVAEKTAKTISASDTPVGYATIDTSKFAETVTVSTKSDLVKYAKKGGCLIYVDGMIDMSEGMLPSAAGGSTTELDSFVATETSDSYKSYITFRDAYAELCSSSTDDKSSSSTATKLSQTLWKLNKDYGEKIKLAPDSNTAIIGLTSSSGIKGGTIQISGKSNVVLRNLTIQDAYDPFPHHEKDDGFNAQWDGITIQGSCSNIWVDHCTIEDTMEYVKVTTKSGSEKWQTYDGLCDIKGDGKGITVSFCKFYNHDKTMLIGSSDTEGDNSVRKVTLHHNYFLNCGQRLPMVRNTTIHIFNNYYDFDSSAFYSSSYAVGVRKDAVIYAENNYFGSGIQNSFKDSDGKLYSSGNTDESKKGCSSTVTEDSLFSSAVKAYDYSSVLESAADAKSTVGSNAGAGVWTVKQ